jgi:hypothetical protein
MHWRDLVVDAYERLPGLMKETLSGLTVADLDWQPHRDANSIGWTAWHLARVQDAQIADVMGDEQLWIVGGWHRKFRRPPDPEDTGYGHTVEQVRAFGSAGVKTQLGYLGAVTKRTVAYLGSLSPAALGRTLDEPWFRPLPTVGVRIVSILADCHQHAGQAGYIRGLLKAREKAGTPRD